jgi:hypothetical protein
LSAINDADDSVGDAHGAINTSVSGSDLDVSMGDALGERDVLGSLMLASSHLDHGVGGDVGDSRDGGTLSDACMDTTGVTDLSTSQCLNHSHNSCHGARGSSRIGHQPARRRGAGEGVGCTVNATPTPAKRKRRDISSAEHGLGLGQEADEATALDGHTSTDFCTHLSVSINTTADITDHSMSYDHDGQGKENVSGIYGNQSKRRSTRAARQTVAAAEEAELQNRRELLALGKQYALAESTGAHQQQQQQQQPREGGRALRRHSTR